MAFFRNGTVNVLNLHYAIINAAHGGAGAFVSVYLLKAGIPLPTVFLALASILVGRFVLRPLVIGLAARAGLKAMVITGALVTAVQFPLLAEVNGIGAVLIGVCLVSAIGETIYWTAYHAYFAALGDDEHRGHQVGVREALAGVIGIVSPLATGILLVGFGPHAAFGAGAAIMALSVVPLLFAPDVPVARRVTGGFRAARGTLPLLIADGWIGASYHFVWQIALFVSLGQSFVAYGGALAVAALVGAVGAMVLGRHIDAGHGRAAVVVTSATVAAIIVLRAFGAENAAVAVVGNALGALGACLFVPTLMTAVYTAAKKSPCGLRFNVVTEGGWDFGGAAGLLVAALMAALGLPLWATLLTGLLGVGAILALLPRFYSDAPTPSAGADAPRLDPAPH